MKGAVIFSAVLHRLKQSGIFKKGTILNLLCDPSQFLVHNPPGPHVQMSHLGIPHLSLRQSHRHSAGIPSHEGVLPHQCVHHRGLRLCYRIAFGFLIESVSVQNHKHYRFLHHTSLSLHRLHKTSSFYSPWEMFPHPLLHYTIKNRITQYPIRNLTHVRYRSFSAV